jgi:thymidylate synthase (FAD)
MKNMINEMRVGDGNVFLIAGGGRTYCDTAAKFCRTEKDVEDLIASPQSKKLIKDLIESGHSAALEFDDFIFGVQGYSRVTEVQLVRKRHASYMISSGRDEKNGKRKMNIVLPDNIRDFHAKQVLNPEKLIVKFSNSNGIAQVKLNDCFPLMKQQFGQSENPTIIYEYDYMDILNLIETWYTEGVILNIPEEDLRYMKPQGTEFKAAIKMNAAAIRDWAKIRMCTRAQTEIRDLCTKMVTLAREVAPELMDGVGPSCVAYGYCTEKQQHPDCVGKIPTRNQVIKFINSHRNEIMGE